MSKPVTEFTAHTGAVVCGDALKHALAAVADDWAQLGRDIYAENAYASHVTQAEKDNELAKRLAHAELIRAGYVESFTIAQRLDTKLTGKCVPLFK